jgi:asparaginyl-tRNA synthetase
MCSVFASTRRPLVSLYLGRFSQITSRAFISTTPDSVAEFLEWKPEQESADVKVNGFIRSVRAQKKHHFISLGDGTSLDSLQAVVPADQAEGWDK